jgi:hypothetical protein
LPLVLQLGFAGNRHLLDRAAHPDADPARFEAALQPLLTDRLRRLPAELGLTHRHFVCGLSSLAIGADTLFARACAELGWPRRVFLPQQREDFLAATGSDGTPDFTPEQRVVARQLFASPHIIQERVVSGSAERHARFQDVNLELVRVCDVLVCLVRPDAAGQPGGTLEALAHATARRRPVLELRVRLGSDGRPQLEETWRHRNRFTPPALPAELAKLRTVLTGLPALAEYCAPLKAFASRTALWKQRLFKGSALVVIIAHVLATLAAVLALKLHGAVALPWILGGELLLLASGLATHEALHRSHAVRDWALARLVAEIARSTLAARQVRGYLAHLFSLPLPASLRPLLRTLNVLHLRETRALSPADWVARRGAYVRERLRDGQRGQIPYFIRELRKAARRNALARWTFLTGSAGASLATLAKLLLVCDCLPVPKAWHGGGSAWLGALAILLPVAAVAALSLAASFDLEARLHTYREMLNFLRAQRRHLRAAPTEAAFHSLALETEARLLGETAAWYARRAFTGIA